MNKKTSKPSKDLKRLVKAYSRYYKVNYTEALRRFHEGTAFATATLEDTFKTVVKETKKQFKESQKQMDEVVKNLPQDVAERLSHILPKHEVFMGASFETSASEASIKDEDLPVTFEEAINDLKANLWGKEVRVWGAAGLGKTVFVEELLSAMVVDRVLVKSLFPSDYKSKNTKYFTTTLAALEKEADRVGKLKSTPTTLIILDHGGEDMVYTPTEQQALVIVSQEKPATEADVTIEVVKHEGKFGFCRITEK